MSTYLLAFIIGKFDHIELSTKRGVKVRGYTKKGHSQDCLEHTKIGAEAIDMYEDYFKIKYPLPKLDLVAYHKMQFRAMENWGLITFKDNVLVNNPKTTPSELF